MPPTAGQIAAALAGQYGPVPQTWRCLNVTRTGVFLDTITPALMDGARQTLDNRRAIITICEARFRRSLLPAAGLDHVQIIEDRLILGETVSFSLGIFRPTFTKAEYTDATSVVSATLHDLTAHLISGTTQEAYTVAAGVNYFTAIGDILDLFGLAHSLPADALVTPVSHSWAPATTYRKIVEDLAGGVNYFPPWPNTTGVFVMRERINPALEAVSVVYSDSVEPRMPVAPDPYVQDLDVGNLQNRCVAVIDDFRNPDYGYVTWVNDDPTSPISTVNESEDLLVINADSDPSTKCILNTATADAIAQYELRALAGLVSESTLVTFPDPRRQPRETYTVDLDGIEDDTTWTAIGWERTLDVGGKMTHHLSSAAQVDLTEVP